MTAAAPTVTLRVDCGDCDGLGYKRATGRSCATCRGRGVFHLVGCPVHGERVARDVLTGGLLGRCSGCAADVAAALQFFTGNANGPGRSFLAEECAAGAKEVSA